MITAKHLEDLTETHPCLMSHDGRFEAVPIREVMDRGYKGWELVCARSDIDTLAGILAAEFDDPRAEAIRSMVKHLNGESS